MMEATMLDVSAGDQDVAMASSPYYHADAAMMDADYAQPETEEIDMEDDDAAPEYEMADDEHYYDEHQPQIYDAEIVDAPIDHAPLDAAVHLIDEAVPAEPTVLHELHVAEVSAAAIYSADPGPAPVFGVSDLPPAAACAEASHEPPSHVSPHPGHVSPLALPASDLPIEHPEAPAEPSPLPSAAEPAPFSNEAVAPTETESTSQERHSVPPVPSAEENPVAPESQPAPETNAIPETLPGPEFHVHDAPPARDADGLAHEAHSTAEPHAYEPTAPGETTLVEYQVSYDLYEDDDGSDPSDEDLFVPPPTVAMSVQNEPATNYVLFELPENASASASSSSTAYLFSDRSNLYYEPVSAVFAALRQIDDIEAKYEYCELAFCAPQLNLTIAEDSKYASEVSFHDFGLLHDSFGLDGPLQVQLQSITPRFIKRFNFLRAEVAKMMSAAAQASTDAEGAPAATAEAHSEYDQEAGPAEPLEPQLADNNETDPSRIGVEQTVGEAAEDSGYVEDDEAEPELYVDAPDDVGQGHSSASDDHVLEQHGSGVGREDGEEDGGELAPEGVEHAVEEPAAAEDNYTASEQPENDASEHGEHAAQHHAATGATVEDETSGEGDEEYSLEYEEYEDGYDEDGVEGPELVAFQADANSEHDQRPVEQGHDEYYAIVEVHAEEVYEVRQENTDVRPVESEPSIDYDDVAHIREEVAARSPRSDVIDLTEEHEAVTDQADPEFQVEELEEYAEGDNQTYSAVDSTYEEGDSHEEGNDAAQEQEQEEAHDADAAEAYEEDDQATLSSSDDRAAQTLPTLSSKRSHDELLREDPQFDGDGLGEDDHDSKRARVE